MNYCRQAPARALGRFSALFLFPVVGFVILIAGTYILLTGIISGMTSGVLNVVQLGVSCCSLVFSLLLFCLSIECYSMETRKYEIDANGIRIRDKIEKFYFWHEISEIAIVAYAASASLQNYQTVICCFFRPRTKDFLSKILHSYIYGVMNQDNFVIIDYKPSILDEFSNVYPGIITDYRKKQLGDMHKTHDT